MWNIVCIRLSLVARLHHGVHVVSTAWLRGEPLLGRNTADDRACEYRCSRRWSRRYLFEKSKSFVLFSSGLLEAMGAGNSRDGPEAERAWGEDVSVLSFQHH